MMNVNSTTSNMFDVARMNADIAKGFNSELTKNSENGELREAFKQFVGQTVFGQMLKSMRKTVDKPAYFHGGRAEEIFQEQLDRVITEKITNASADSLANPMFELFNMNRR